MMIAYSYTIVNENKKLKMNAEINKLKLIIFLMVK